MATTLIRTAAWHARPAIQRDTDGPGRHSLLILGAYDEAMELVGTREELLTFAASLTRDIQRALPREESR